ncbi:TPA: hypothetical protein DDW35_13545 [Candidatus Sumerlaeota bacterium]|nr:hypothetical protein [Candidatus Sumerlaeota bacterium]
MDLPRSRPYRKNDTAHVEQKQRTQRYDYLVISAWSSPLPFFASNFPPFYKITKNTKESWRQAAYVVV